MRGQSIVRDRGEVEWEGRSTRKLRGGKTSQVQTIVIRHIAAM